MLRVRPDARLDAREETTYPRADAASCTRRRADSETCPRPLSARDTVAVETPASRATSSMLAMRFLRSFRSSRKPGRDPAGPRTRFATGTAMAGQAAVYQTGVSLRRGAPG